MGKRHNPVDYNLAANPSLPKTNSPWRVYKVLILAGLACAVAWYLLRAPIRVSRPTLELTGERAIVTALVTNETHQSATLSLRVVLAHAAPAGEASPPRFDVVGQEDVQIRVPSRSTAPVTCGFPQPKRSSSLQAEVRILRQE